MSVQVFNMTMASKHCISPPPQFITHHIFQLLMSDTPTLWSLLFNKDINGSSWGPSKKHSAAQFSCNIWLNIYTHSQDKGATLSKYHICTLESRKKKGASEHEYVFVHIFTIQEDKLCSPKLVGYMMVEQMVAKVMNALTNYTKAAFSALASSVDKIPAHDSICYIPCP
ncbi:hypothetical protein K466DRAFT_607700 [Polyporus arcularius HHB13444]|uniref:Uncharacterized protein n=1 Tax=Polyporus arcularius HHB13444 TaxID=1314778 RepID=A0A5C3NNC7_9APHY|nr:hypothetical protein K466DRAFT_607700 [Polyporus arcularius HHB13444]